MGKYVTTKYNLSLKRKTNNGTNEIFKIIIQEMYLKKMWIYIEYRQSLYQGELI